MDGAGAALAEPTAKHWAVEIEILAEREQKRHIGIVNGDRARPPVDVERPAFSHGNFLPAVASFASVFFEWFQSSSEPGHMPYDPAGKDQSGAIDPGWRTL